MLKITKTDVPKQTCCWSSIGTENEHPLHPCARVYVCAFPASSSRSKVRSKGWLVHRVPIIFHPCFRQNKPHVQLVQCLVQEGDRQTRPDPQQPVKTHRNVPHWRVGWREREREGERVQRGGPKGVGLFSSVPGFLFCCACFCCTHRYIF